MKKKKKYKVENLGERANRIKKKKPKKLNLATYRENLDFKLIKYNLKLKYMWTINLFLSNK